ncbi:MAG TPA: formyltetrahydrofolate deformylase [Ilumatobacter sp.]|nr:formyltetrahydrofolate deformylase [Ilumatobacter sp.]
MSEPTSHILTLSCADRPGIVHAVSAGLLAVGGNITENHQFSEPDTATFCMRTVVSTATTESDEVAAAVATKLAEFGIAAATDEAEPEQLRIKVRRADDRPNVAILVSTADHCLVDLLYRWRTGGLQINVVAIVSNHTVCQPIAAQNGIEFVYLPVTAATKAAQEAQLRDVFVRCDVDLVVLARYMQVLSDQLCTDLAGRAINIHHSFLPGFKGAKPYHQAFHRGVKIVGATAHFVTADLDEGPIIEQDVARVDHTHTPEQLTRLGQDTERLVLSRAVRLWSEDRIMLVGTKTVVFH